MRRCRFRAWFGPFVLTAAALVLSLTVGCGDASPAGATGLTATAPTGGGAGPTDADLVFCVTETNRYRALVNRPPLTRSTTVEAYAALAVAADHASGRAHGYFGDSHNGNGLVLAENELLRIPITINVQALMRDGWAAFWREGPGGGHYENMAGSAYTQVGCGALVVSGIATIVQDFR